jgi:hypothetical protein
MIFPVPVDCAGSSRGERVYIVVRSRGSFLPRVDPGVGSGTVIRLKRINTNRAGRFNWYSDFSLLLFNARIS